MKKLFVRVTGLLLILCVGCSSSSSGQIYKNGNFTTTVTGYGGEFKVTVSIEEDKITKIEIGENQETKNVGTKAFEYVTQYIIDAQSTDVDGVTGATKTSDALKEAVDQALEKAKKK